MTRRLLIAGNWKMNKGPTDADSLAMSLKSSNKMDVKATMKLSASGQEVAISGKTNPKTNMRIVFLQKTWKEKLGGVGDEGLKRLTSTV